MQELSIIQKTYDLIKWYVPILNRLPRNHKFMLGDRTIADYNQTLKLNPQFKDAMTKREIAQGVWDEKKRQEKVERDRRQSEEEVKGELFHFEIITVNAVGKEVNRKPGTARQKIETLNGVNLEMVYIPGGTFTMGAPQNEAESNDNEKPQHPVTIQPFFMGKYAVTQAQWKAVTKLPKIQCDLTPDCSRFKGDNRPVETVSWRDAVEFCARLSQKTERNYRLPSEAEWEYACRAGAGTTTPFHFGETITPDLANYDGNYTYANAPKGKYRQETVDVGSFLPNAFGLYEMHGNVWEWCADPWHDNYNGAPTDGSVWDEKNNNNPYQNSVDLLTMSRNDDRIRLLRGGSWDNYPWFCRSALRLNLAPAPRNLNYGFRFVCVWLRGLNSP
jgi:formylglycine-generating enzyme required for sulfatase activity